jgi:hypothetical protein
MTKEKITRRSGKKEPQRSLKEKRADKIKKKADKKNFDKLV